MEDRWLSVNEICTYLGVGRDAVYKWIEMRNMPAHRAGRLWKFKKEEVDQWMRGGGADESSHKSAETGDALHANATNS
ncbi:MAG: helix-turn-helix domain-containing protein [Chloroflexota bacterium]|nr:helix-turn-helix domain-containing protein [Chloroflexota bacterium]